MEKLYAKLGHKFREPALVVRALRHRSAGKEHNERMEFLGDAVLGFIIADVLCNHFPLATEGELSRVRASLVQQATLAELARTLNLGEFVILGPGELKTGGANRESILADAFEALISALYLDGGLELCRTKVLEWYAPKLASLQGVSTGKDPKTRLQELLQARRAPLPVYEIREVSGRDHAQTFVVSCQVPSLKESVTGSGSSRKIAEQRAAEAALALLLPLPTHA